MSQNIHFYINYKNFVRNFIRTLLKQKEVETNRKAELLTICR